MLCAPPLPSLQVRAGFTQLRCNEVRDAGHSAEELHPVLQEAARLTGNSLRYSCPAVPLQMLAKVAVQMFRGVAQMHSCGIAHVDLKEENVLVSQQP